MRLKFIMLNQMSKAAGKSRKKRPNLKLNKHKQVDIEDDEQAKISTPHIRLFEARRILGGQQLPSKFKFRQSQIQQIQDNIKCLLGSKKANPCKMIMITGSPGSGKTLCANSVLHRLEKEDYKVIYLNSNMIKNKADVQCLLASELLDEDTQDQVMSTYKLVNELEKAKTKKCILYIEEVELFFNSHKENLSEEFFEIFTNKNLKILLLGISNTIDALLKYGEKLKVQVSEVTNIVFNPYTVEQLKQIIADKIEQINKIGINLVFEEKLIRFAANKVNQFKKGDMRMIFQFLNSLGKLALSDEQAEIPPQIKITVEMVNKSLSFFGKNKNKIEVIENLTILQKLILIAIYNYLLATDDIAITEEKLQKTVRQLHGELGMGKKQIKKQEIEALTDYGLLAIKSKNEGKHETVVRYLLKIPMQDIKWAFQKDEILGNIIR